MNTATPAEDPLWYKDAVIYQLHLKSFYDANNDGIGDFPGLMAKLDYIVELGVDTIWMLPFYPSPRRDDGYDIAEYRGVHADYGTMADVRRFIKAAHAKGLRIITELVINHTSDQHPWFKRAREAKPGSAARNFYVWSGNDLAYSGTRVIFCDTEKSNWTWDPVAEAYYWHRFYSHQPDLNFDNPAVLKEVMGVMRFWLEMGVDGLRLDAVPYLVEREGTSNENLPETHDILKKIRANLDASYPGRMLLAEANQWPEDAQQYFGDGDECHMCFHFPLMPRMYMAIAREDRHPITDIMRQTPDIPANCQWAVFLRNHDELTLEMVTSQERDYLWNVYASDRRARINLGIRRRLAPLMERDRSRIELMNSLLFSMPGTPVIYYGDEIGMGDNVHLGDRDGVRTPMQWSPDRNGGFSRADPEQLVLPPVMGSLYGFESVNVESQSRDPHSLLNWMRRMLAMRRQHRAFGRGTLRFLYPGNRKVLAYLREYEDELILCVANLSRSPQAVELDLSQYAGRVPVELMGGNSFPSVGHLTYLLTLPPHGFYWFQLSTEAAPPPWHTEVPEPMSEQTTLVIDARLGKGLTDSSRTILEDEILPAYLARRRWFASKHEPISKVKIVFAEPFSQADDMLLAEIEVKLKSGRSERYQLPVTVMWDADNLPALPQQLSLAKVRRGPKIGVLTDAFSLERFARAVIEALRQGVVRRAAGGAELRFLPEPALATLQAGRENVRWLSAEQSNSSLLVDDLAMLKLVRKINPGIHPEAEMTRHLSRLGFRNTATLLGEVVRVDAQGEPSTLMLIQSVIANQGDGWQWTLDTLNRTVGDAALTNESHASYEGELLGYEALAKAIGTRLGELHAALNLPTDEEAFEPVPATEDDTAEWARDAYSLLERALDELARQPAGSPAALTADIELLTSHRDALLALPARLAAFGVGSARIRIHGDFHLGQILVASSDAYLIDFEGEPAQPLERRRRKTSPLRDVAGLLRSFDYAAAAILQPTSEAGAAASTAAVVPVIQERRVALLARFRELASRSFLDAYSQVSDHAEHPWVNAQTLHALLDLFLVEKAAYEVLYETANRPTWLGIPVGGLATIARRLLKLDASFNDVAAMATAEPVTGDARVD
ncbi:maltose alpha-D-glucosyltransferase [soil metagenome]